LTLAQGEVELVYGNGVKLLLIGPAEFTLQEQGGELKRGGLVASVPLEGHGFTIETPTGKVTDLGTQFGLVVDDFGMSEVSVFEGKVEALPVLASDAQKGKFELTQGRALQWSNEMVRSLDADPRRLPVTLASFSRPDVVQLPDSVLPSKDLLFDAADSADWLRLGQVQPHGEGLVLQGLPPQFSPPYLVSQSEVDPTHGPVTVVCEIRFPEVGPQDDPSFAILTRSAAERSAMDRPWKHLLATCVRCNFRAASDAADGLLEAATKNERDRELTSLSWRGFRRPQEGILYRLVMRDDGVNISFTVSEVDEPSVSKTVTCRSLFRGYKNHIALEGWDAGTTIVERVSVFQASPMGTLATHFSREVDKPSGSGGKVNRKNVLLSQVPPQAKLILKEDFESAKLDPERWSTLGDVVIDSGAVSLGSLTGSGHIDTFHPRPYLLTRREFTPTDQELFVLGRITFEENFLQGYGGSFAVVTRCRGKYGTGPGWAVSALDAGVRSNFWPASTQEGHVLELFKKPKPDSITFLTGKSWEVHPESRSYYFCLQDDGQRAAFTLQDVADPRQRETIESPTGSRLQRSGLIGFEGCWGSRVLLDDVRVYVLDP
jgi:hypothetical protein